MKLLFAINYSKFLLQNPQGLVLGTIILKRQWNKSCSKSSVCVSEITISWNGSPGSKDKSQGWVVHFTSCFRSALSPIRLGAHPGRAVSCWCWQKALPSKQLQLSFEIVPWTLSPAAPLGQHSLTKHTPLLLHVWIYMRLESGGGFHVPELKFSLVHRAAAICCTTAASTLFSSWYHSILLGTRTSIMHWRLWFALNVIKNTLISMLDMFNIESTFNKTLSGFHSTDTGNFDWRCSTLIS